jgi:hypothetical protein
MASNKKQQDNVATPGVPPLKSGEVWCAAVEVLPESEQKHIEKLCVPAKKLLNSIVMVDVEHIKNYAPDAIKTVIKPTKNNVCLSMRFALNFNFI